MGAWSLVGPSGTEVSLAGLGVTVRSEAGAGMPPLKDIALEQATAAGDLYQRTLVETRVLTLRLVSRQRHANLPAIRLALLQALNPDLTDDETPAYVRYAGSSATLQLAVVYRDGLEGPDPVGEALELRFRCYDPIWMATALTAAATLAHIEAKTTTYGRIFERAAAGGGWSVLPGLSSGSVNVLAYGLDGTLYAGGAFTTPAYIAYWDTGDEEWKQLGSSNLPNYNVYAIAFGADGSVYVGGYFTGQVKRLRPGATAWETLALDAGYSDVRALVMGDDGKLYAGGYFTATADVTTHVAVIDPDAGSPSWSALGGGTNHYVHALARGADGKIYAGGNFTSPGAYLAVWNPYAAAPAWAQVGDGVDGTVSALVTLSDGRVLAGGSFTGLVTVWNGVLLASVGDDLAYSVAPASVQVSDLAVRDDGQVFACGLFDRIDDLPLPNCFGQWNGYAWFPLDVDPPGTLSVVSAIVLDADGTLAFAHAGGTSWDAAGLTTLTNSGTASAYPLITITGPGRVHELTNWTTGQSVYFDLALVAGEVLTLDLRPGVKSVRSSFRGNVIGTVLPGSKLASFRLLPGTNVLGLFVREGDSNTAATIAWYERHWSLDGAG